MGSHSVSELRTRSRKGKSVSDDRFLSTFKGFCDDAKDRTFGGFA
jgi:hypothetical protein